MSPAPSLGIDDSLWPLRRVRFVGTVPTQLFEDYLANTVERLKEGQKFVTLLDISQGDPPSTEQRQRQAQWFREHDVLLRQVHLGAAFIITSPIIRLALSAIFYFKPLPSPYFVTARELEAVLWTSSRLEEAGLTEAAWRVRDHFALPVP